MNWFGSHEEVWEKLASPKVHLTIGGCSRGSGAAVAELCFQQMGHLKDLERLRQLFDLLAKTLDQLHRMGSALPHSLA